MHTPSTLALQDRGRAMHFSSVNWLSVVAATVAAFLLGAVWYHPAAFGGVFMQAMGLTAQDYTSAKLGVELGKQFLVCLAVAVIATGLKLKTVADAIWLSLLVGIGIVGSVVFAQHYWGGLPLAATLVDLGFAYISVLIFSLFACLWRKQ